MRASTACLVLVSALAGAVGCSSEDPDPGTGGSGGGGGGGGEAPACTEPTAVPCEDQVFQQMNLQDDRAPGLITNEADGAGFRSFVDATAGGAFASDPHSYVYGRFTDAGLVKVELSDEESLDSMDWDLGLRRYVARVNSGHSGPSCVRAARVAGAAYDDVTAAPEAGFFTDTYFSESCEIIPDASGLPNSPATVLSGYWTYPGCVSMSGNVYVLRLASGRAVKLTVENYYTPAAQEQCDTMGTVPMSNSGAANFQIRWAFLP